MTENPKAESSAPKRKHALKTIYPDKNTVYLDNDAFGRN